MKFFFKLKNKNSGFTLIEMAVVLSIFAIISSLVIFNYSDFRSSVSLDNLSQDIALSVRRAQSYATSVQGSNDINAGLVFPGYGMHFSTTAGPAFSGGPKSFIFFADLAGGPISSGLPVYDESNTTRSCGYSTLTAGNECIEEVAINSTDFISELCAYVGTTSSCGGTLDIVFTRPQPDASICYVPIGLSSCSSNVSSATIKVTSLGGASKKIKVWNTGQISIE
jgi:prepilin-type N-terminal cleavage/methylation domain-containing protein